MMLKAFEYLVNTNKCHSLLPSASLVQSLRSGNSINSLMHKFQFWFQMEKKNIRYKKNFRLAYFL